MEDKGALKSLLSGILEEGNKNNGTEKNKPTHLKVQFEETFRKQKN